jgi:hypothetical protein
MTCSLPLAVLGPRGILFVDVYLREHVCTASYYFVQDNGSRVGENYRTNPPKLALPTSIGAGLP